MDWIMISTWILYVFGINFTVFLMMINVKFFVCKIELQVNECLDCIICCMDVKT